MKNTKKYKKNEKTSLKIIKLQAWAKFFNINDRIY